MLECCKIIFSKKDSENLSIKNELPKNLQSKWDIAQDNNCDKCLDEVKDFFDKHSGNNYYYDYSDDYLSNNDTQFNDNEVVDMLEKWYDRTFSPIPWLDNESYIFYTQEDLDYITELYKTMDEFYNRDWEFEIEYKNKKYTASLSSDSDCHHRLLTSTDFHDKDENNLQDIFDKEDKEEFCFEIRIKDHSYDDGAGSAYGHIAPDYELVLTENDFRDGSYEDEFFHFISEIEDSITNTIK